MRSRRAEVGGITPCVLSVQQWVTNWGGVLLSFMVSMKFRILRSVDQFRILTEGCLQGKGRPQTMGKADQKIHFPIPGPYCWLGAFEKFLIQTVDFWSEDFFSQSYKRKTWFLAAAAAKGGGEVVPELRWDSRASDPPPVWSPVQARSQ